ncbi:hypothetical protein DOJK_01679 [Patescibacteria group bacterium]|nr:hypothetical protein DOJK_01679 [Patescibacteria group bacterium]
MRYYLFFCLMILANIANAEVDAHVDYRYYTAYGDDDSTLLQILNKATPILENNRRYHGYTKWHVRWRYRWYEQADGRCKITSVKTTVTGDVLLPQLENANAEQTEAFERYVTALKEHELGHYNIGKEAGETIDQYIAELPEMPSCKILEKTANDFGYQTLDEYRAQEKQYDADTKHGKTQGAWLER